MARPWNTRRARPELLAPAKDLEVLRTAVDFGADAVYIGGEAFSLRARARNFGPEDMRAGIAYAHARGARVYVAANIFAHNGDIDAAAPYFTFLQEAGPDAVLVSDPGMFSLAKKHCPDIPLHISTQANSTNYETFRFWHRMGAARVVCARELSLREIAAIRERTPDGPEMEAFVHGAMCISYSGRCLLSAWFTGRDANRGACTHPCRWKYALRRDLRGEPGEEARGMEGEPPQGRGPSVLWGAEKAAAGAQGPSGCKGASMPLEEGAQAPAGGEEGSARFVLEEMSRPGEYFPIVETGRGTYIMSSRDLCMIGHLGDLARAGIDSLKIEGRMKTALYVASVTRAYRRAIDDYLEGDAAYAGHMDWYLREIKKCTYRDFTTGFYLGRPDAGMVCTDNVYQSDAVFLGIARDASAWPQARALRAGGRAWCTEITQKNKFSVGDRIEIMRPDCRDTPARVLGMWDEEGNAVPSAPHPGQRLCIALDAPAAPGDLLRK